MAQKRVQLDRETFSCSICLDLLKDPVTIPCGHSYCMTCINTFWDEDQKGIHSCPQCTKTFRPRPVLLKNTMLAALVEELKKTGHQAAPADHHYAGPGDVACDFCTGRKMKAVKSCLDCLISYCEKHLQPHYDVPLLKKHQLVEPSKNLQEHKGHDTVSAAAEGTERQKELEVSQLNIQQRIQKDVKLLQQELKDIRVSADKTVEDSEKMFSELIHLIQNRSSEVEQQIRSQQEIEESRVKELQEKLEQEIRDLERKDAELKQLSDTPDYSQFLHNLPSVSALSEFRHSSSINIRPLRHFEDVTADVKEVKEEIEEVLKDTWEGTSHLISLPDVLLSQPQPKTRAEFLRYSCNFTLDPETAHQWLVLSDGDRKVSVVSQNPDSYPDHPDRFSFYFQVLSRESLTRRCYWEVKTKGTVDVAVAYKSVTRSGDESEFGTFDDSWSLESRTNTLHLVHDGIITPLSGPRLSRVGVYVDHSEGILSFYSISDVMTLLHTVQTSFTEPLHAGLSLYSDGVTAEIIV